MLPKETKQCLRKVALKHVREVLYDAMILADHSGGSTLSLRHLKLALSLRGFAMLGEFVPQQHKASSTSGTRRPNLEEVPQTAV